MAHPPKKVKILIDKERKLSGENWTLYSLSEPKNKNKKPSQGKIENTERLKN